MKGRTFKVVIVRKKNPLKPLDYKISDNPERMTLTESDRKLLMDLIRKQA